MVINELKWTKKTRITVVILFVALATAGLEVLSQMNQVAEAAILTPIESPTSQTIFHDDFSGDLSNWTIIGGTWAIENEELDGQTSAFGQRIMIKDLVVDDFIVEYKVRFIGAKNYEVGLVFRGVSNDEPNNCYWVGLKKQGLFLHQRKAGVTYTLGYYYLAPTIDTGYSVKIAGEGQTLKVWLEGTLRIETSNADILSGTMGVMAWSSASEHVQIDDVNVSSISPAPRGYDLAVRAGVTQIVITCTWSGSGNVTIANLTNPVTIYYESDMSMYEKTTISFDGITSTAFNIKRATLSILAPSSSETWSLYLSLSGVTTYEVSAETS